MNSIEIETLLQENSLTNVCSLGVFAADKIPKTIQPETCFIANTDISTKSGHHWVAFYIDKNCRVYYFDPLGYPPVISFFKRFLRLSKLRWSYNRKKIQHLTASTCGPHCVYFLRQTCRTGNPLKTVQRMTYNKRFNDMLVHQYILLNLK